MGEKKMNNEKEIKEIAGSIKTICESFDYSSIAAALFEAGYCEISAFAGELFKKTEKYIDKWSSRAEEEKDKDYAWGMRSVCASVKFKLNEIIKEYETEGFFNKKLKEENLKEITEIIHISSSLSLSLSDSEKIAEKLLLMDFGNRFLFLSSFFSKTKKFLEEEEERTRGQISDDKDDAQYVVGKIFLLGRFKKKIRKLEEEMRKEKEEVELVLENKKGESNDV